MYDTNALMISAKSHSLSIMDDGRFVFSFDRAGRLYAAYRDGHTFVRGLSGIVLEKWHDEGEPWAPKRIRVLTEEEARAFLAELWSKVNEIVVAFRRGRVRIEVFGKGRALSEEDLECWLERILAWDIYAYARDRERFLSVYKPVSILPPDQYLALVLQVTEGCHWNKCAFCDFYRDRRFRIKTDDEVRRHIAAVREFLGDSITLRRSLFLADANALIIPQERLVRLLEIIHEAFSFEARSNEREGALDGIYSFLDAYSGMRKTVEDFAALKSWHVKRLYLGVESGHDELLRFVNKPGTAREALEVVSRIKAAGLSVGVIILIGLGGDIFFEPHVRETIALLNEMPLGREDIIYLSPLYVHPGSDYEEKARAFGIRALTPQELKQQIRRIREGMRFASSLERPRISLYDVREFVY
ncbi:MAG: radical SAM protein [Blastocatellia bacterium]|nr:radical SAM protein [Blastocatellia bacterium]MCX7752425.1 radical SAM protein [Blastocatellia bacterium]MDW8167308.1 radical SAM protein [Acidobacteriota bacterium]